LTGALFSMISPTEAMVSSRPAVIWRSGQDGRDEVVDEREDDRDDDDDEDDSGGGHR